MKSTQRQAVYKKDSVLGPVLLSVFVNDLQEVRECTLIRLADDNKPQGAVNMLKDWADIKSCRNYPTI